MIVSFMAGRMKRSQGALRSDMVKRSGWVAVMGQLHSRLYSPYATRHDVWIVRSAIVLGLHDSCISLNWSD